MSLEILRDFRTSTELANRAATDLANRLSELLERQASVNLVLTGGTVGIATVSALAPLLREVDLSRLQIWWGDERFVELDSPERNFVQAHDALLSKITISEANWHQMPSVETGSLFQAAEAFASHIDEVSPSFDIVLLGMGPDGHVASLFPGSTAAGFGKSVVAEASSPKPPSERISLSYRALSEAKEVWFLVSGADKASAVAQVFAEKVLPASRVSGQEITRWYLDTAAAAELTS